MRSQVILPCGPYSVHWHASGRDDYRLIPYAVTDTTFEAFVHCLQLWRWRQGEAKTIVGSAA